MGVIIVNKKGFYILFMFIGVEKFTILSKIKYCYILDKMQFLNSKYSPPKSNITCKNSQAGDVPKI